MCTILKCSHRRISGREFIPLTESKTLKSGGCLLLESIMVMSERGSLFQNEVWQLMVIWHLKKLKINTLRDYNLKLTVLNNVYI